MRKGKSAFTLIPTGTTTCQTTRYCIAPTSDTVYRPAGTTPVRRHATVSSWYQGGCLPLSSGPGAWWAVRQPNLEALQQSHPHLRYQDFLVNGITTISLRTDKPPFNDVRVRRAISQAIDRQAIIEAVYMWGEPSPAVPRGLAQWSLPIDQLGAGAKYYQSNPKEAKRLLAEAGYSRGLKTPLATTGGYGHDLIDAVQEGMTMGPYAIA